MGYAGYYDDEPRDYGFELPDKRETWDLNDGSRLELHIQRRWFTKMYPVYDDVDEDKIVGYEPSDDGEMDYAIRFILYHVTNGNREVAMEFPEGKDEGTCSDCVNMLYADQIDDEETIERRKNDAEWAHEQKMESMMLGEWRY